MCSLQGMTLSYSDDSLFLAYKVNGSNIGGGEGATVLESLNFFILWLSRLFSLILLS